MALRVLLDATAIPFDRGGVGRYVDGLVSALARTDVSPVVVCQPDSAVGFAKSAPSATVVHAPAWARRAQGRFVWEQVGLPDLVRRVRPDVLHSPHYTHPIAASVPVVVTLHDATFFSHPEVHSLYKRVFFRSWTRVSARRAARIIVPSRATQAELERYVTLDPGKVDVAYHGVDQDVFHPPTSEEIGRVRSWIGLGTRRYVAFLGTIEPRKNLPSLVSAFAQVAGERHDAPALVLAGGSGWDDRIDLMIATLPAAVEVVRPGYLPLEQLRAFLGGATVVVYPSLGEGFGLPVLEAMACGAVVLTTPRLALPEVGGNAVAYSEPDPRSIAAGLRSLLEDGARRAQLSEAATARAHSFTWDASAQAHVSSYLAALTAS